jgi:ankyrin repeat protein
MAQSNGKKNTKFIYEFGRTNGKNVSDRFIALLKTTDPNFQTDQQETPLSIAVMNEDLDMIELLVSHGAILDYRVGYKYGAKTPLQMASANNKIRSVRVNIYFIYL